MKKIGELFVLTKSKFRDGARHCIDRLFKFATKGKMTLLNSGNVATSYIFKTTMDQQHSSYGML